MKIPSTNVFSIRAARAVFSSRFVKMSLFTDRLLNEGSMDYGQYRENLSKTRVNDNRCRFQGISR